MYFQLSSSGVVTYLCSQLHDRRIAVPLSLVTVNKSISNLQYFKTDYIEIIYLNSRKLFLSDDQKD